MRSISLLWQAEINSDRILTKFYEYHEVYKKWKRVVKRKSQYAFCVDISIKEKVRAIIMKVCPRMMPKLISARNKRVKGEVL